MGNYLMIRKFGFLALCSAALLGNPSPGDASPILDSNLASFAVLGASTVTNTGATTLTGNLGVAPGSAITGFFGTVENDGPGTFTGTAHQADAFALTAQGQLANAKVSLGLLGPGTLKPADLGGLTLGPGVYTVLAGATNLTGVLTLDGGGNPNAGWVFQLSSTLITSPGSSVNIIGVGSGGSAGVYWNVGTAATLDTTTAFAGNILAGTSITMNDGVTIGCGRALAQTGAVTMIRDRVSIGCGGALAGSGGLNGGFTVPFPGGLATPLPAAAVPEPASIFLLGSGLLWAGRRGLRRKRNQ